MTRASVLAAMPRSELVARVQYLEAALALVAKTGAHLPAVPMPAARARSAERMNLNVAEGPGSES